MVPDVVKAGKESVSIVALPSPVGEPPYDYALLPSGVTFQSCEKTPQVAYDEYIHLMGEEKDFNDTRFMLKDSINANNMRRIMAVCVGMNARSVLCSGNKDSSTLALDDVKTQINTTQLCVVMKKYYEIGLALELHVNAPTTVLEYVQGEMLDIACDLAIKEPVDLEMKAVYQLYIKRYTA